MVRVLARISVDSVNHPEVCMRMFLRFFALFLFTSSLFAQEQWLSRYNAQGNALDEATQIEIVGGNSYVIGSSFSATNGWDIVLKKIDGNGTTVWVKQSNRQGDEKAVALAVHSTSALSVVGQVWGNDNRWHVSVARFDTDGNELWSKSFNATGSSHDIPVDAVALSNGNLAVAVQVIADDGSYGTMVVGIDPSGNQIWSEGYTHGDGATPVAIDAGGTRIAVVGMTFTGTERDAFALILNLNGTRVGASLFGSTGSNESFSDLRVDNTGNAYAVGWKSSSQSRSGVVVVKYKSDASEEWNKEAPITGDGFHRALAIELDAGGLPVITGRVFTGGTNADYLTAKLNADGSIGWSQSFTGPGTATDNAAPRFAGATAAIASSSTSAIVTWPFAHDDLSEGDEIDYGVFIATTSGGQNFNSPTQTVRGRPVARLTGLIANTTYHIVVRAKDRAGNGEQNTREVTVTLAAPPLVISTSSLPDGQVNKAYTTALAGTGGQPPYSWSLSSGQMPDGIQLQSSGTIGGMPTSPGTYPFRVLLTDAASDTASKGLSITVTGEPPLIVARDTTLPGGRHCYPSILVLEGATLTLNGNAQLCADTITIHGVVRANCHSLALLDYKLLRITGDVNNRCLADSSNGGDVLFYSADGQVDLNGRTSKNGLYTHGKVNITDDTTFADWEFAIPPFARATTPTDPVGYINADPLHGYIDASEPLEVRFSANGVDPDGGPIKFDIDFGDGEVRNNILPQDESEATVYKSYSKAGTYTVTLTVKDDDGKSSQSKLTLFLGDSLTDGSGGLGVAIDPTRLTTATGDTAYFSADDGLGEDASVASYAWNFGDGNVSTNATPLHVYSAPGRYKISLTITDDSSHTATSECFIYVYNHDSSAVLGPKNGNSIAATQHVQNINWGFFWLPKGWRVIFPGAPNINFGPMMWVNGANGNNGGGPAGNNGQPGVGIKVWARGNINIAGGIWGGGNGGNGANGGAGANGGSLNVSGKNIVISGGVFAAGDGGNAAPTVKFTPASGTAVANGKTGGNAGKRISFNASRCVEFTGPVTIHTGNGGKGGDAIATGGAGADKCTVGQDAANARAKGGPGGKASKRGAVQGCVIGIGFITVTGGQGGDGGNATATGGRGGHALQCETTATGGKGGYASATGGKGGESGYSGVAVALAAPFKPGKGGDATANAGDGGNAVAKPIPDPGADGCPGQKGGDATARGGKGGRAYAENGRRGDLNGRGVQNLPGAATANGSDGGDAFSTGGKGGNGTGCNCAGGPGGVATSNGGSRGETKARSVGGGATNENPGTDGDANATGGEGGKGGNCCNPPAASGGNGGAGGAATANAGANGGQYTATGGPGGNGGDGKGPGGGGGGGNATGSVNGNATVGANGAPGNPCFIIREWYIFIGLPTPGTIPTGTRTLPVQKSKSTDPTEKIGEISIEFSGQLIQTPTGGVQMRPNSFIHFDPKTFTGGDPIPPNGWPGWYPTRVLLDLKNLSTFAQCFGLRGFFGGDVISEVFNQNTGGTGSTEQLEVNAPGGSLPDRFDFFGFFTTWDVEVDPWICVRWIDP